MISEYLANITERELIVNSFDDLNYLQFKGHIYFEEEYNDINRIEEGTELDDLKYMLDFINSSTTEFLSLWLPDNFDDVKNELGRYITSLNDNNSVVDISQYSISDILEEVRISSLNNPDRRYIYIIYKDKSSPYKRYIRYCYNPLSSDFKFNKHYNMLDI